MDNLMSIVDSLVQEYTVELVNEFDIDIKKCEEIWQRISRKGEKKEVKEAKKKSPEKKEVKEEKKKSPEKKGDYYENCDHDYTRKPREGEKCGVKTKDGARYCSKHKDSEDKEKKSKAVIPKVSPKKEDKKEDKKSPVKKEMVPIKPVFKPNKTINKHVHPDTGMVLKSATDKKIIGKLDGDKIIDLNFEDVEVCKKWRFVVDDSQMEKLKKKTTKSVCVNEDLDEPDYTNPVVDKYFLRGSWRDECDNTIKGSMTKDALKSFVKKEIIEGEYDEEFEENGYPVKLTLDKKAKKIVCDYTDGEGNFCNVNISLGSDDDLKALFKYLADMKNEEEEEGEEDEDEHDKDESEEDNEKEDEEEEDEDEDKVKEEKTKKIMKALIKDEKSEKKGKRNDKEKDDNLSKKPKKGSSNKEEDADIEDVLDEVENEDEDVEEDEQIAYIDDLIKPLNDEDEDYFYEYLEEVEGEERGKDWMKSLFQKKGSNGKTIPEVASEKGYKKVLKTIKSKYIPSFKI